ncbi:uncharacterized protein [Nicotiana sylvestris]|uniref:uncharacterized protein n=1 Tax=Nicotiana sylvestris TaxID=4096 RepID=UPI00388C60C1
MVDFDVILGMDWLSPYHVVLDCHAKTGTLAMPGLPWIEWQGYSNYVPSRVISYLKAQQMVRKGCLSYLTFVRYGSVETPTIDSVLVVHDFLDVFPTDLPGMSPDRDIDFSINLVPGTQPISIPPYHMEPAELKELKEQLQELFEKGFICEEERWHYEDEEHAQHLRIVLQRLREEKLYAKFSKCELWLSLVAFLGHVVSSEGIQYDPKKIVVVQSWPRLSSATEIRRFLGLRKANMLVDGLSRKAVSMGSLEFILIGERPLAVDVQALANQLVRLYSLEPSRVLACVVSRSSLIDRIRECQYDNLHLLVIKDNILHDDAIDVTIGDDGVLRMQGRICVPNVDGLWELILEETHTSRYSIHLGAANMYQDLRQHYWWRRMKKDIVGFCISPVGWFEPGKARLLGSDLVQYALDKVKVIQERLCTTQSRQKSYDDRKSKLSPRFISPFEVLRRIGEVTYELALPLSLSGVHLVFHVSMLRKYIGDPSLVLDFSTVQLDSDLTYDVEPVAILESRVCKLRSKDIASVKVQWRGQPKEESTWETK